MNCLNSDILSVIYKLKHELEYINIKNDIITHKNKIIFNNVMAEMSQTVKNNLLRYSIYNPRFGDTCIFFAIHNKKRRQRRDNIKCSK
jgi:hypothetical protein